MATQTNITTVAVNWGLVYLNDRVAPATIASWDVPAGRVLIITDIVVQNRAPGDAPVAASQFTRFSIPSPNGTDVFFLVVGNKTLNLHLRTGIPVSGSFYFHNIVNSDAPFAEFHIMGRLRSAT
jgi:hypothetical protein